ncbi:type VI secretion system tube protein TssD [Aquimarina sp. Aq107]|uniref:type VI secretion system tube protein TssD n=1 Tax=Aquimarina sp. Aq107 TaxID=1191912 RepID=UPI000D54BBDA|nr:type VI secretion system tube protein TssD [Aquimarina sp. Aq107]
MAFQAKLFINDEERNVIDSTFLYQQLMDSNGRPKTTIQDGKINVLIESTKNDELFYDWMFSTHTTYNGYVRFFKRDGFSKLFDFEFANCHCVHLEEKFNAEGNSPLKMELVLSPGIQRVRGQIFEKNWNPSNPFTNATPITEREEKEPKIIEAYWMDEEMNERIDKITFSKKATLIVKTENVDPGETVKLKIRRKDSEKLEDKDYITYQGVVNEDGNAEMEPLELKENWLKN